MFYYDSNILNEYFNFQKQSNADFWQLMAKINWLYKFSRIVPKFLTSALVFKRLSKDENSSFKWFRNKDNARIIAYFGSIKKYLETKTAKWKDINFKKIIPIMFELTLKQKIQNYGYGIDKTDDQITQQNLIDIATAHGGKCLDVKKFGGNLYKKLKWKNSQNKTFLASAYTILRAGHWYNSSHYEWSWEYNKLCKNDKIFANIWYDSHNKKENIKYYFDKKFKACYKHY